MTEVLDPTRWAEREPDRVAVVMADTGQEVTYSGLDRRSAHVAQLLHERGLRPDSAVAFLLENRPEVFDVAWAAARSGLYYTAVSTHLEVDEAAYIVDNCGARAVVVSQATAEVARQLPGRCPQVESWITVDGELDGFERLDDALADVPAGPPPDALEGVDMLYSSGTTGRPKGVRIPRSGEPYGTTPPTLNLLLAMGFDNDTLYLSPAPLYHAAPLRFCMGVHRLGGTTVVMRRFEAERTLELIQRFSITHAQFVPTMFVRMLKLDPDVRTRYDVSSLRTAVHAAAPCPVEVKQRMMQWWGPILWEYYAGSEGNGVTVVTPQDWLQRPGTVGRAVLGVAHILDDDHRELPAGEVGGVYFSDPPVDFTYHGDEEKTASVTSPQGWKTIGDVGYLDEDGYLYLTDRRSFTIISGGVNVYPQEAEDVLVTHPAVLDVGVFGIPDEDLGERVHAAVQLVDPLQAGDELADELLAHCRQQLSSIKCPRAIDFVSDLPRTPTGKLQKRKLKERYWGDRTAQI